MRASTVFTGLLAGAAQITTGYAAAISLQRRETKEFGLYAYGEGLSGLTVFSRGNSIYVGDSSAQTVSTAAVDSDSSADDEPIPIIFTTDNNDLSGHDISAHANTTDNSVLKNVSSDSSTLVLAIPKDPASSGSHAVVLADKASPPADVLTDRFVLYGADLFVTDDSSSLSSEWYTTSTGTAGVYQLNWKLSGEAVAGEIEVSLRTTAP